MTPEYEAGLRVEVANLERRVDETGLRRMAELRLLLGDAKKVEGDVAVRKGRSTRPRRATETREG